MQFNIVVVTSAHLPTEHSLYVPRTRTTLGDRSFAVAGPRARVWNSLPATLRQMTSYGQFSRHLNGLEIKSNGHNARVSCECGLLLETE